MAKLQPTLICLQVCVWSGTPRETETSLRTLVSSTSPRQQASPQQLILQGEAPPCLRCPTGLPPPSSARPLCPALRQPPPSARHLTQALPFHPQSAHPQSLVQLPHRLIAGPQRLVLHIQCPSALLHSPVLPFLLLNAHPPPPLPGASP